MQGKTIAVFTKHSVNLGSWLFQVRFKSQNSSTQKEESIDFIFSVNFLWKSTQWPMKEISDKHMQNWKIGQLSWQQQAAITYAQTKKRDNPSTFDKNYG